MKPRNALLLFLCASACQLLQSTAEVASYPASEEMRLAAGYITAGNYISFVSEACANRDYTERLTFDNMVTAQKTFNSLSQKGYKLLIKEYRKDMDSNTCSIAFIYGFIGPDSIDPENRVEICACEEFFDLLEESRGPGEYIFYYAASFRANVAKLTKYAARAAANLV